MNRFGILWSLISFNLKNATKKAKVIVCCKLHNFIEDKGFDEVMDFRPNNVDKEVQGE